MTDVVLGMEVVKLDPDPRAPWRMTVDVWQGEKVVRYQVSGKHYNGDRGGPPERTLGELARVQVGNADERMEIARELDRLDREYAEKVAPLAKQLMRSQIAVIHGPEALELLDRETHMTDDAMNFEVSVYSKVAVSVQRAEEIVGRKFTRSGHDDDSFEMDLTEKLLANPALMADMPTRVTDVEPY